MRNRSTRTHNGGSKFNLSVDEDRRVFEINKVPSWAGEEASDIRTKVVGLLSKGYRWIAPGENTSDYDEIAALFKGLEHHKFPRQAQQEPEGEGGPGSLVRTNWDSIRAKHPGRMIPGDPTGKQTRTRYEPT